MIDITSSLTRLLYQQEEAAGAKVEIIHASAGYARAPAQPGFPSTSILASE